MVVVGGEGRSKGDRHGRKRNGDEGAFGFVQRRAPETANDLYALRPRGNLTSPRCPVAVDGKAESRGRVLYAVMALCTSHVVSCRRFSR